MVIDGTRASTAVARPHGRAPRAESGRAGACPLATGKTTPFVAGLATRGLVAPGVLDRPISRDAFEACGARVLVPEPRAGGIVVTDNLSSPKGPRGRP